MLVFCGSGKYNFGKVRAFFECVFADFDNIRGDRYPGYVTLCPEYAAADTFRFGGNRKFARLTVGVVKQRFFTFAVKYVCVAFVVFVVRRNFDLFEVRTLIEYRTEFHRAYVVRYAYLGKRSATCENMSAVDEIVSDVTEIYFG